jgi:hypothetical protein
MVVYQGYNNRGEIVYRFKSMDDLNSYFNSVYKDKDFFTHTDYLFYCEPYIESKAVNLLNKVLLDLNLVYHKSYDNTLYTIYTNEIKDYIMAGEKENAFDKEMKAYNDMGKTNLGGKDGGNYDDKGNSAHYQSQFMEYVREQERKYGTIISYIVCLSQADKYAQRAGIKEGVPAEKDLTKRSWYLKAAQHFKLKIDSLSIPGKLKGRNVYVPMPEEIVDVMAQELDIDNIPYVSLSEIINK